ncbi:MAG: metal-dependent transcriptional regulator [Clostridiales bacterium]|nr:metal-dependent transcriptional regulator [Clostridiales bacterium]
MTTHKSSEDYLEAILVLSRKSGNVRSIDIVNQLGYSKPSVSVAMKKLRQNGDITMDEDGYIKLTESGMRIADTILERHNFISDLLISLGVNKETALDDACKIEHDISAESFEALKKLMDKINIDALDI